MNKHTRKLSTREMARLFDMEGNLDPSSLVRAAEVGEVAQISFLLSKGVDVNTRGQVAFTYSI